MIDSLRFAGRASVQIVGSIAFATLCGWLSGFEPLTAEPIRAGAGGALASAGPIYDAEPQIDEVTLPNLMNGLALGLLLLAAAVHLSLSTRSRGGGFLFSAFALLAVAARHALESGCINSAIVVPMPGLSERIYAGLSSMALVFALGHSVRQLGSPGPGASSRLLIRASGVLLALNAVAALGLPPSVSQASTLVLALWTAALFVRLTAVRVRMLKPGVLLVGLGWGALLGGILAQLARVHGGLEYTPIERPLPGGAALALLFLSLTCLNARPGGDFRSDAPEDVVARACAVVQSKALHDARLRGIDIAHSVEQLRRLMDQERMYCDEDLSLTRLAAALELRPDQLSLILNHELRTGFADYINQHRVAAAQQMLTDEPERSIPSIASAVGFNTRSAFYGAFRKFTGRTPGEFRPASARVQTRAARPAQTISVIGPTT